MEKPLEQPKESTPIRDNQDLIKQYLECFDGVEKVQGEYHILFPLHNK